MTLAGGSRAARPSTRSRPEEIEARPAGAQARPRALPLGNSDPEEWAEYVPRGRWPLRPLIRKTPSRRRFHSHHGNLAEDVPHTMWLAGMRTEFSDRLYQRPDADMHSQDDCSLCSGPSGCYRIGWPYLVRANVTARIVLIISLAVRQQGTG